MNAFPIIAHPYRGLRLLGRNTMLTRLIVIAIASARKDNPDMQRSANASGTGFE
jgi:hypothetical protein